MKKITYILLSACFLLTSCEDFLNRDPDAKVGSGDYFTDEGSLLTYINGFIQKYTPSAADLGYGDGYSDIMATEKVVHVPDQRFVDTRPAERLVDQ